MIDYSSISRAVPIPIYEIGSETPIGYVGEKNYIDNKKEVLMCPKCCNKGKIEKQGWFGIVRLVKCSCRRSNASV